MKKIILLIVSVVTFLFGNRIGYLFLNSPYTNNTLASGMFAFGNVISSFGQNLIFVSYESIALLFGLVFALVVLMFLTNSRNDNDKNYRKGEEHGSSRWATKKDLKKLIDKDFSANTLLSEDVRISMNTRKTDINNNIAIIGDPGSGKTRDFLKGNLLQFNCNPIITDPKGDVLNDVGTAYQQQGCKIKIFNVRDFTKSMKFNPFPYLKTEKDFLQLTNLFITNTKGKDAKEDFWVKAEELIFTTLIGLIHYVYPQESQNFSSLIDLILKIKPPSEDGDSNEADELFAMIEKEYGAEFFPVVHYGLFKKAAGDAASGVLISAATRVAPFNIKEVREITEYDEMNFDDFATEKTALFLIIDDRDTTFNFLVGMLQSVLLNRLCDIADDDFPGKGLPIHHRFYLDEFPNIGRWANFEKTIATVRSRNISLVPMIQLYPQLINVYGKEIAKTIIGNCATWLFLGGTDEDTLKLISTRCGKTTIDKQSVSENRGTNGSTSFNNDVMARDLILPDEVEMIGNRKCIVKIKGVYPFLSTKMQLENHPNYKMLADYDKANIFDVKAYITLGTNDWLEKFKNTLSDEETIISEEDILVSLSEMESFLTDFDVDYNDEDIYEKIKAS